MPTLTFEDRRLHIKDDIDVCAVDMKVDDNGTPTLHANDDLFDAITRREMRVNTDADAARVRKYERRGFRLTRNTSWSFSVPGEAGGHVTPVGHDAALPIPPL